MECIQSKKYDLILNIMKILHTSDWHLGKRLDTYSRHQEQVEVLDEIIRIADAENVDIVLVAGDLFDTFNPPVESIDLFYKSLKCLANNGERAVVCIAGNHDSPDRIEAPDPLARECGIIFVGYPNSEVPLFKLDSGLEVIRSEAGFVELKLPHCNEPLRILTTPYANEIRLKSYLGVDDPETELRKVLKDRWQQLAEKYCDTNGANLLLSHLFFTKEGATLPEEPDDEKPILHVGGAQAICTSDIPSQIQYVALGHLHRKQIIDQEPCPVVYSGSPLSYSFSEANQTKYVVLLEFQPDKKASLKPIELHKGLPLKRVRSQGVSEALEWLKQNPDCMVELTIVTDAYLNASDRKLLNQTHQGIIQIIPEMLQGTDSDGNPRTTNINLSKGIEELFAEYFQHTKGLPPDPSLMELFKEVIAIKTDE